MYYNLKRVENMVNKSYPGVLNVTCDKYRNLEMEMDRSILFIILLVCDALR